MKPLTSFQNDFKNAPIIFAKAIKLPRDSLVEYQTNLHTGRRDLTTPLLDTTKPSGEIKDDNDDEDDEALEPIYESGKEGDISWEQCTTSAALHRGTRGAIFVYRECGSLTLQRWWQNSLCRR
jgi:hypothetical protein